MDFSISALQGQTVTQWPQETQLEPAICSPPSHRTRGMFALPVDRERLVDLHVLAGLDAAAAENALVGIVAVEGVGVVLRVGLGREGAGLVLYVELCGRVVDGAVPVVVVADGAVEIVVLEDAVEGLALRDVGAARRAVTTFMPAATRVPQARTSSPSTSTMQVSQVSMGPICGR